MICLFFFSLASFPSNALALTSLFFLHPARAPINTIEVTFSLGLVQRPDASPFKKVILFFFLSLSHTHIPVAAWIVAFFLSYPDHIAQTPCERQEEPDWSDRLGADGDSAEPSLCSTLTNWGHPLGHSGFVFFPPSNQTTFPNLPILPSPFSPPPLIPLSLDCTKPVLAETVVLHLQSTPSSPL